MLCRCILTVALVSGTLEVPRAGTPTRWTTQERHNHVELYSEIHLDTQDIWKHLEQVTKELEDALAIRPSGKPIQVMLFRNHKSYVDYLARKIPQASRRKAIYYRNGDVSQIYAYQSRSLLTDLRHEMTHAVLHQDLPFIPLWLDEGLAEYFEEVESARRSSPRISSVQWKARVSPAPSLVLLESIASAEEMDAAVYRDSWAWAFFLLHDSPESLEILRSYLAAIQKGEAPGSFSSFAGARIPELQARANSYFRKMSFRVTSGSSRQP